MHAPLLDIRALHLWMRSFEGEAHVLQGVDLQVGHGEVWGVVGETGCGKSLTGLSISRLVPSPPARYGQGQILFDGQDLLTLPEAQMRPLRGGRIGMIFQDPTTNLNPLFRISDSSWTLLLPPPLGGPNFWQCRLAPAKGISGGPRAPWRWRCSSGCVFRTPPAGWTTFPISSQAACASGC